MAGHLQLLPACFCRGTEKQHVAYDYAERLSRGAAECNALIADVFMASLVSGKGKREEMKGKEGNFSSSPKLETCPYLNVSICPATETNNVSQIIIIGVYIRIKVCVCV